MTWARAAILKPSKGQEQCQVRFTLVAAPGMFDMLICLIAPTMLIIGIMYFLIIRPHKEAAEGASG